MRTAAFLVDTGPGVGLGHLRRSCVLLDAMVEAGYACRLYCADPKAAVEGGRTAEPMPAKAADLAKAEVAICDSYRLDQAFLTELRGPCRIIVAIDDTAERKLDVDIVLNHNIYGDQVDYSAWKPAQVLTGPACALVDRRILAVAEAYRRHPVANDVVVSFGGTDDGARGAEIAKALLPRSSAHIHLVVAPGCAPAQSARALAQSEPRRVTLALNPDMPGLLSRARVYIGGAGVTALEALVIGLDLVLVVLAPNQRLNAEVMARSRQAVVAPDDPAAIAAATALMLERPRAAHPPPVDGGGASRVIAAIEQLLDSKSSV